MRALNIYREREKERERERFSLLMNPKQLEKQDYGLC